MLLWMKALGWLRSQYGAVNEELPPWALLSTGNNMRYFSLAKSLVCWADRDRYS